jgi:hypothetical protein
MDVLAMAIPVSNPFTLSTHGSRMVQAHFPIVYIVTGARPVTVWLKRGTAPVDEASRGLGVAFAA